MLCRGVDKEASGGGCALCQGTLPRQGAFYPLQHRSRVLHQSVMAHTQSSRSGTWLFHLAIGTPNVSYATKCPLVWPFPSPTPSIVLPDQQITVERIFLYQKSNLPTSLSLLDTSQDVLHPSVQSRPYHLDAPQSMWQNHSTY